jgi:hypothetical protein
MRTLRFLFVGLLVTIVCAVAIADTIILKDGTKVEGKILEETDTGIRIKTAWGEAQIEKSKIEEVIREKVFYKCPICNLKKKVPCPDCLGTKKAQGRCPACKGKGSVPCKTCRGTGKCRCDRCKGTGKRRIGYMTSRGLRFKVVTCNKCRGYGWFYCGKCKKTGAVTCRRCKGTGRGRCAGCKSSGSVACPFCRGTGKAASNPQLFRKTYAEIQQAAFNPEMTDLQKKEYLKSLNGKTVFWIAILLNAEKTVGRGRAYVNLDESCLLKELDENGNSRITYIQHLRVDVKPQEIQKLLLLPRHGRFWILGELAFNEDNVLSISNAEIYRKVTPPKKKK